MRLVTLDEYKEITPIIKKEMMELAMHENKNSWFVQTAINNCYVRGLSDGTQLFQLFSPGFINIIEVDYIAALKESSELFGTGNAKDVIHALYLQAKNKHNCCWDENRYTEYLSNENFCLLIHKKDLIYKDDILRIDLFRQLKESKKKPGSFEFIGGIFHALKHFSVEEQCASILTNQNVKLFDVEQLIYPIANAFFKGDWIKGKRKNTFESSTNYLNKLFSLEFYKEDNRKVSFVNTVIPKSNMNYPSISEIVEEQYSNGLDYFMGRGVKKNYSEAVRWFEFAANHRHADAQFRLGFCYYWGWGVEKDYCEAIKWLRKAAYQDHPEAQYYLGSCYLHSNQIDLIDYKKAKEWYHNAAENGNSQAQLIYGEMCLGYHAEYHGESNYKLALIWFQMAAEQGNVLAQLKLYDYYRSHNGFDEEAQKWLQKVIEQGYEIRGLGWNDETKNSLLSRYEVDLMRMNLAEEGDIDEQYYQGLRYEVGMEVLPNLLQSLVWYRMAAEQGHVKAMLKLAEAFSNWSGIKHNYEESFKWYLRAAENSNDDAMFFVGECYRNGLGVAKDDKAAIEWYKKSSRSDGLVNHFHFSTSFWGDETEQEKKKTFKWFQFYSDKGYAFAQNIVGTCYQDGYGIEENQERAVELFKKAANQGHSDAIYNLGGCYFCGYAVRKNLKKATDFFHKAAVSGHCLAQNKLGDIYHNGLGVLQNDKESVVWYQKSAEAGCTEAQLNLANCFMLGWGKEQNEKESIEWFRKAAEQGSQEALVKIGEYCEKQNLFDIAINCYRKAVDLGNMFAPYHLGYLYDRKYIHIYKNYPETNYEKAEKWYLIAAEQGHALAQYQLSILYLRQKKDREKAEKWKRLFEDQGIKSGFTQGYNESRCQDAIIYENVMLVIAAAKQGFSDAQYELGNYYREGNVFKGNRDTDAVEWYKQAADQGHLLAQCMLFFYDAQDNSELNKKEIKRWYHKVMQHENANDKINLCIKQIESDDWKKVTRDFQFGFYLILAKLGCVPAQIALAQAHHYSDRNIAKSWYLKAAEQGSAEALYQLAMNCQDYIFKYSNMTPEDVVWLRKAAEQGHSEAQYRLGCCINESDNVHNKEAAGWLLRAAEQGNANAQILIGQRYLEGNGVPLDFKEAVKWFRKALSSDERAVYFLQDCYENGYGVPTIGGIPDLLAERIRKIKDREYEQKEREFERRNRYISYYEYLKNEEEKEVITIGVDGETVNWYFKDACLGNVSAMCSLAQCYEKALGVKRNMDEAKKWYLQSALNGNADAQFAMGKHTWSGWDSWDEGDHKKAVEWYRLAAEQGHVLAQYQLGECYERGLGAEIDYIESAKWYRKAAEQGYALAQYNLGVCYESGYGVDVDIQEAVKWYRLAAEQGDINAMLSLGECYETGVGFIKDWEIAYEWYQKAAEGCHPEAMSKRPKDNRIENAEILFRYYLRQAKLDNAEAQFKIGDAYNYGFGSLGIHNKDEREALRWLQKAAEMGHSKAQYELGCCYRWGKTVKKNEKLALTWIRKSAENGHDRAQYTLANYYLEDQNNSSRVKEAVKWFRKAAVQGLSCAQLQLANCYYEGIGVSQDYAKAVKWYMEAAKDKKRAAYCMLGLCSYYGKGIDKDLFKAVEMFQLGVDCDFKYLSKIEQSYAVEACYLLGKCYDEGTGTEQNSKEANTCYYKAASSGHTVAQYLVGNSYLEQGRTTYRTDEAQWKQKEAVEWYQKAAIKGYADAQEMLGFCYFYGYGTENNYQEAVKWFRKAAKHNIIKSCIYLGFCYYDGLGVKKDNSKGKTWFGKAAKLGDQTAKYMMILCNGDDNHQMNQEDLLRIRDWCEQKNESGLVQYMLANCYYYGCGVEQDFVEAANWFEKAQKCSFLYPNSQYMLGKCYEDGTGVEKSESKAMNYYRHAFDLGHILSGCKLGHYYLNHYIDGYYKIRDFFIKGAESGLPDAQYGLGLYFCGSELHRNRDDSDESDDLYYKQAVKWFSLASDQGHVEAKCRLGRLYLYGQGVKKDENKAFELFSQSAEKGCAEANYWLGNYYRNKEEYEEAVNWYRKGAQEGHSDAITELGKCYHYGRGVDIDYDEAIRLYRKAYEHDELVAEWEIMRFCQEGHGNESDIQLLIDYYQKRLNRWNDSFYSEKLEKAKELLRNYKEKNGTNDDNN